MYSRVQPYPPMQQPATHQVVEAEIAVRNASSLRVRVPWGNVLLQPRSEGGHLHQGGPIKLAVVLAGPALDLPGAVVLRAAKASQADVGWADRVQGGEGAGHGGVGCAALMW